MTNVLDRLGLKLNIATCPGVPASIRQHVLLNQWIETELQRAALAFEMMTCDRENSRKLADMLKERAIAISGSTTARYSDVFDELFWRAKHKVATGVPISELIDGLSEAIA